MTHSDNGRVRLVAALSDPAAYPHPTGPIEHLETHISDVFLAGEYAYKLKKPLDFGFLDFTTLEKRRRACQDEVRLNARLAPDIYLGVAAVCALCSEFRIVKQDCPDGNLPVEYAVRMRRLPQDGLLDRLAAQGKLARVQLVDIARQIARFHAGAERGPEIERYGALDSVAYPVRQNFEQTEKYIGVTIGRERHARLRAYSEDFLRSQAARFAARVAAHRIVDGHGDLHLRNMCLHDGRVVIFDCVEFNQAFRAGDVMNDIAFLTMDLDARGLPALGNDFLNEYLEWTQDYGGLALLDFYQIYRAYVRGKVTSFLMDGAAEPGRREAARREAEDYFQLAERYLAPRAPGLLITCGLSGSGKTTAARQAAAALGGVIVRSDAVRKHLAGIPLGEDASAPFGQGIYTPALSARTYQAMLGHARAITDAGRWAILDATYHSRAARAAVAQLAGELRVPFAIVHCLAERDELARRLHRRAAENSDISDAGAAILDEQARRFEEPAADEGRVFTWRGGDDLGAWLNALARR
ncbi:MAG: AAA family ATPase [Gammaproteobacteria bacterium]|nr:AAA family ATPase [Gammaproteobacteria bacterium]